MQGGIEADQHVVEAHFGTAAFFVFEALADPASGVLQHGGIGEWQRIEGGFEADHGVDTRVVRRIPLPGFGHAIGGQTREPGADIQLFEGFIRGPGADFFEPGFEVAGLHLATIDGFGGDGLQADVAQLGGPLWPGRFKRNEGCSTLLQAGVDQFGGLTMLISGPLAAEQRTYSRHQRGRPAPVVAHPVERIVVHRVAEQPPIVAQHFAEQVTMVGFQGLGEQAATVERMFAQHALAPTVDGRDRRFVHPLRGDIQAIGTRGPLFGQIVLAQLSDQRIRLFDFIAEEPRSFGQADTDAFAQLLGGGVGEGHNEDLRGPKPDSSPPWPSTRRRYRAEMVKVLPVPALASINWLPFSGNAKAKGLLLMRRPPRCSGIAKGR